jgi:hypothetical protein
MNAIEVYVKLTNFEQPIRCNIVRDEGQFKATLFHQDFEYTTIQEPTIWQCLEGLAVKIDELGKFDSIEGNTKQIYLATLKGYLVLFKQRRIDKEEHYG